MRWTAAPDWLRSSVEGLLSFGYTLATSELTGACAAQGLDPAVGLLHDLDYGRPSLALDVLEEFRQPFIDRLVLSLVNRNVIQPVHFESRGDAGVLLNETGRARFLELYHRAVTAEFDHRPTGARVCYRDLFTRQAARIRTTIETGAAYEPFSQDR